MTYNVHPIVVHFPIAFLFVYSVIKILPLNKWIISMPWKQLGRFLLFIGFLGSLVARSTGEIAEHLVRPNQDLVEMHSLFAGTSVLFYGILVAGELLTILNKYLVQKGKLPRVLPTLNLIERIINKEEVAAILSFFGLIAISITGVLGGVMVYGTSADPIAPFILNILGL